MSRGSLGLGSPRKRLQRQSEAMGDFLDFVRSRFDGPKLTFWLAFRNVISVT